VHLAKRLAQVPALFKGGQRTLVIKYLTHVNAEKRITWRVQWLDANGDSRRRSFRSRTADADSEQFAGELRDTGAQQVTRRAVIARRAHYIDPKGKHKSETYRLKTEAEKRLDQISADKRTGSYVDPARSRITIGEWAGRWLAARNNLKPSTQERYASILREHVVPRWGTTRLKAVGHGDVQEWVTKVSSTRAPATVHKVHRVLSLILTAAVNDGRLARNPAAEIDLPRVVAPEQEHLDHRQVAELADACGQHRLVVLFLAYTGCRFGEMAALRVGRLDLMRRRATIAESVTLVKGSQTWELRRATHAGTCQSPPFLVNDLAVLVAGKSPDELVFTGDKGGALRSQVFQRSVLSAPAYTHTNSDTPQLAWPSRRARTCRSSRRCSATSRRR
jgi:integrase